MDHRTWPACNAVARVGPIGKHGVVDVPLRQVRAQFRADTITVYQAYSAADRRAGGGRRPFRGSVQTSRMTWIKPVFLWMMYRCGWGRNPARRRVLGVEITRDRLRVGADARLSEPLRPSPTHPDRARGAGSSPPVPCESSGTPTRSLHLQPLRHRSLQVGLSATAVDRYVDEWIVNVADLTPSVTKIRELLRNGAP